MEETINIQCVYGNDDLEHIGKCIVPNLGAATRRGINFLALNYQGGPGLPEISEGPLRVVNIDPPKAGAGFAENHNRIFQSFPHTESFVMINPDCIPCPESIDYLLARKTPRVAIVEGRQWPFEHPKLHDPDSMETPWASFAFCLVDSAFYERQKGMDELYFLYCEDVDLSWRAWLSGYSVVYEPLAQIMHFTDGYFARPDYVSPEMYYSARNFLLISRKFFGDEGEKNALAMMRGRLDPELMEDVLADYNKNIRDKIDPSWQGKRHGKVKIYGINCFAPTRG